MTNEELVIRIKAGADVPENMLQLWEQNRRYIHTIAVHYQGRAELEDMEQEGYLALYDAVDGWDPDRGCKFLTYADYWIRQRMRHYAGNVCHTARIPLHVQEKIQEYRKVINAFSISYGRKPTRSEVACNMGLDDRQIDDLEAAVRIGQACSLDSTLAEEDGSRTTLGDMVSCDADVERDVTSQMDQERLRTVLWPMVDALPGQQGYVIRQRYQEQSTLKNLGERLGVTIGQVKVIENTALRSLRYSHKIRLLRSFMPEYDEIYGMGVTGNGVKRFNATWESSTERAVMKLMEK